ncbi:hypothetical protein Poli38472_011736 [Pythium oligandrum]|uniref:Uncharacterized protein n=1 Tax=Pythium oligandrum TaxID=41045 RepID=A0A8K1C8H8_PYTOL|nr:hypothetical protein Poli38472_011736 [Pythium oligandrum]|eukprot:TMW58148.1 hypothetical protein Poli38472_011736 [Pythium oligandrum]
MSRDHGVVKKRRIIRRGAASEDRVEFAGDVETGKMEKGLDFWKNPTDPEANKVRAAKVIQLYDDIISGKFVSPMIMPE